MCSSNDTQEFFWEEAPLTGLAIAPVHHKPEKMIVLLHGYQGDAVSNMEFARILSKAVPQALVVVPNGIEPIPERKDPNVRQWFNLSQDFDGNALSHMPQYLSKKRRIETKQIVKEIEKISKTLNKFVLNQLEKNGLGLNDCFLVGISQGGITAFGMMLYHKDLYKDRNGGRLGGMISIGSGIVGADKVRTEGFHIPPIPVLLVRGSRDEIFSKNVDCFSKSIMTEVGMPVDLVEVDAIHYGLEFHAVEAVSSFLHQKI